MPIAYSMKQSNRYGKVKLIKHGQWLKLPHLEHLDKVSVDHVRPKLG